MVTNKKSVVMTVVMLLVMMFSICAFAEYGVNTNYPNNMVCLQNRNISTSNLLTPKFTTTLSAGADVFLDGGTITSPGTMVRLVGVCNSDGTLTGSFGDKYPLVVAGTSSYVDGSFYPSLKFKTNYRAIFEPTNNLDMTINKVVVNYH